MTNPPSGGSVSPPGAGTSSADGASDRSGNRTGGDFGATTLSGRTLTEPGQPSPSAQPGQSGQPGASGAAAPTRTEHRPAAGSPPAAGSTPNPAGQTRADVPLVPGPTGPDSGIPGVPGPAGAPGSASGIRGIRTGRNRGPRRARLQIRHINPVTVLKFSCVLSIALFFVWLIIIGVLFGILDAAGVIGNINDTVTQLNGSGSKPPITSGIVFGGAAIVGVINIVLFIALSTIGAVIYNLCADLVGGIEITLSER